MKDKKRMYIYGALAIPFVAFGAYVATLPGQDRGTFFLEFKQHTLELFGYETELGPPPGRPTAEIAASDSSGPNAEGERPGGGGGEQGRPGSIDPAELFASRDADGDGKLTGDEIHERMRERFDQIDTDQDGAVSLEEFEARMARRRQRPERPADPANAESADENAADQSNEDAGSGDATGEGAPAADTNEGHFGRFASRLRPLRKCRV